MTDVPLRSLPSGWRWSTLGEIGRYWNGRGFKKSEWSDKGRPIVRIQDLTGTGSAPNHYDGAADERNVVRPGDLLVSWAATLGVYVWKGPEAVLNQHIFKVESLIDRDFHRHLIQYVLDDLRRQTHGTGMVHITRSKFESTPVPVPPVDEQAGIVASIEEQFSRVDAGVESLRRVQRGLRLLRSAVLWGAIQGRLVPQRPNEEPGTVVVERALVARRQTFERAGRRWVPPVDPDLTGTASLPRGWAWASLDALAEVAGGVTKDAKRESDPTFVTVPYLRVANVQRGHLDLRDITTIRVPPEKVANLRLLPGDILFTEGGDRDKLGRGWVWEGQIDPCIHQNHIFRGRPYFSDLQPKFISWHANTFGQAWFLRRGRQTTNLASVSLSSLKALPIPMPPLEEQRRICSAVELHLSILDSIESAVLNRIRLAGRLQEAVLREAFAGRLVA